MSYHSKNRYKAPHTDVVKVPLNVFAVIYQIFSGKRVFYNGVPLMTLIDQPILVSLNRFIIKQCRYLSLEGEAIWMLDMNNSVVGSVHNRW